MQIEHRKTIMPVNALDVLGYSILALSLFALLAVAAKEQPYFPGDIEITHALQSFRSPLLDQFMEFIGLAGSPPQTLILNVLFVLIVWLYRMKPEALTLFLSIPIIGTIGTWIRCGINRPRPSADLVNLIGELKDRNCSFPSGHTVNFVVVLGFLIFVGMTRLKPSWHRNLLLSIYALYIVLMGLSRIYVGDHWTSDVIGGLLLGSVFLMWMIVFYEWIRSRFFVPSADT